MLAQLIYLKVFRRRMDYATGIAGGPGRGISYQCILEECGFVPDWGSKKPRWVPTPAEVRAAIEELERRREGRGDPDIDGPLLSDGGSSKSVGYVKKLNLATLGESDQKRNDAGTTQRNDTGNDTGNAWNNLQQQDVTKPERRRERRKENFAAHARNNTPQVSGIQEESPQGDSERGRTATTARGTRLTLTELPGDWSDWCAAERPDLDPGRTWERFRDHFIAEPGVRGVKADWRATWRNWVRREFVQRPGAVAGKRVGKGPAVAEANRQAGDDFVFGGAVPVAGQVIEGEFRRVKP